MSSFSIRLILLTAVFTTYFTTAVNAYTLTLGYPLWRFVRKEDFGVLHAEYLRRLNSVITLPHILLFFACGALVFVRPANLTLCQACAVCALTWGVVGISAFAAGPVHSRFTRQGHADEPGMRTLMRISAARTVMMLAASSILLCCQFNVAL